MNKTMIESFASQDTASDDEGPDSVVADALIATVRADSAKTKLTRLSVLRATFPDTDIQKLIGETPIDDIKIMKGASKELYYFSLLSMTEAYALHLFRVEEKDQVKLVADTVRDESRIYPRPTAINAFLDSPYNLSSDEIESAIGSMSLRPDMKDIETCAASNGARYLYSTIYLVPTLAASLVEWIEVGQKDNP